MMIIRSDDVLDAEPRIQRPRIGVRYIGAKMIDNSQLPAYVADQLNLAHTDPCKLLSYYYTRFDKTRDFNARTVMTETSNSYSTALESVASMIIKCSSVFLVPGNPLPFGGVSNAICGLPGFICILADIHEISPPFDSTVPNISLISSGLRSILIVVQSFHLSLVILIRLISNRF